MEKESVYQSPLGQRYATLAMRHLFSPEIKYITWRRLWLALAKEEKRLGLSISDQQIEELERHVEHLDLKSAAQHEARLHHDVMAHIHAYGELCPTARPIIHLGATSTFVTDNGDLIQLREGLRLIEEQLQRLLACLFSLANKHADLACLGYTHFQPAQLTTLGKRVCLWLQDFLSDLQELRHTLSQIPFLGAKGATGTQASFLELFNGDSEKVKALDSNLSKAFGFERVVPIAGQTYPRKQDVRLMDVLAGIAVSAHKAATDLRLLAHLQEVEEPFETEQVGSSAMPYKRNPILCERVCSLARYLLALADNPRYTASIQWLERSLDDSANRRLCLPESFLTCDAILELLIRVFSSLRIYPRIIAKHVEEELPFMATETLLMMGVKRGADRQELHERIRRHSMETVIAMREQGGRNDLLDRLAKDGQLGFSRAELQELCQPSLFIGRASQQVREFLEEVAKELFKCSMLDSR